MESSHHDDNGRSDIEDLLKLPAYLDSIEVENVLCFKTKQKLDLSNDKGYPAQWTVILGDNGTGKTTLLRCIAAFGARMSMRPADLLEMNVIDMNSEIDVCYHHGSSLCDWDSFDHGKGKICKKYGDMRRGPEAVRSFYYHSKGEGNNFLADQHLILSLYAYGANRRIGNLSLLETLNSKPDESLFLDEKTLINAEEWLLQADYALARSGQNPDPFQERLDTVINILKKLLPDVTDVRIFPPDAPLDHPKAKFQTPYGWVPLSGLSLGYRTAIAWTVDLAARMMNRYPDSEDPLSEPAVVLIDEIDLHLHPKWQRTIMSFLTERFPNTQFIVTAHSPLVVQAAKDANLVLLRREGDHVVIDNDPEIIDNWRVEQILTSIFELPSTYPADIEPLIQRRREILSKSTLTEEDHQELQDLEDRIGSIPTADSREDIRAMDIIRKAAKILEDQQSD